MTNTLTVVKRTVKGQDVEVYARMDITSYTADGETLSATALGLGSIEQVVPYSEEKGYMFRWDRTNSKVLGYTAVATQIVATTDVGVVGLDIKGRP